MTLAMNSSSALRKRAAIEGLASAAASVKITRNVRGTYAAAWRTV
jgi:hypothetical protein